MYGITKEELHPSLIQYIQGLAGSGNGNSSLRFMKSTTTLSQNSNEASINIDEFNKDRDLLFVYKNSIYLEINTDYTINSNSTKIIGKNGNIWDSNTEFNFVAFLNVPELDEYVLDGNKLLINTVSIDKLDSQLSENLNNLINGIDIDGGNFGEAEDGKIMDGGEF